MRYDTMPLGVIPQGPPTNRDVTGTKVAPAPRLVKPGVYEDPVTGRMFTRLMSYELAAPADHAMLQRDLPPGRRDPAFRGVDLASERAQAQHRLNQSFSEMLAEVYRHERRDPTFEQAHQRVMRELTDRKVQAELEAACEQAYRDAVAQSVVHRRRGVLR